MKCGNTVCPAEHLSGKWHFMTCDMWHIGDMNSAISNDAKVSGLDI